MIDFILSIMRSFRVEHAERFLKLVERSGLVVYYSKLPGGFCISLTSSIDKRDGIFGAKML